MSEHIQLTSAKFVEFRLECLRLAQDCARGESAKDVLERAKDYVTFVLGVAKPG